MAGSTIGSSVTHGVTLGTVTSAGTYASPLTITASGGVTASSAYAVFGPNSQAWTVANYGTVVNTGSYGIELLLGGSVTNSGTGLIQGNTGVYITGAAGTVTNTGRIIGADGKGIDLAAGGSVNNSGTIETEFDYALYISGTGAVTNTGTISGFESIHLGAGTIANTAGLIKGRVIIRGAGTVTNSGTIGDSGAAAISLGSGSIYNSGVIGGAAAIGISGVGTLTNFGTILGGPDGGVALGGGSVANMGLIQSGGVVISGSAGTVTNLATIINEIELRAGGYVGNSGTIQGSTGVYIYGGAGTVTNSGTIIGNGNPAVSFGGSGGNLLILDPGDDLVGTVEGSTIAGATNTLELGSTAGAGTVSAVLASEFVNFGTVTADSGAQWTLTADNSLAGITLTDLGTLTNTGTLDGTGTLIIDPATLFNTGSIGLEVTLSGGGYLDNEANGTISTSAVAVLGKNAAPLIANAGAILGGTTGGGYGVELLNGGSLNNTGTGLIQGFEFGVDITGAGTVTNSGTIISLDKSVAGAGVALGSGTVVNTGYITGHYGVLVSGAGYVDNSGTI